ncbi:hypothetical protein [Rossellomorea marisflavi]|uniref:hypothetical protein n=1 Tax=Rossellomorea marisflavi TaxID=189381 RepID=UPI00345A171D
MIDRWIRIPIYFYEGLRENEDRAFSLRRVAFRGAIGGASSCLRGLPRPPNRRSRPASAARHSWMIEGDLVPIIS